jgi:hypothetical protein
MVGSPGYEPWMERVIRQAQEAGKLDTAAGAGKPIPGLSRPYDPSWWARRWIASDRDREQAAELTRTVERALPRVLARATLTDIRTGLESLNATIAEHNNAYPANRLQLLDIGRLISERASRRR